MANIQTRNTTNKIDIFSTILIIKKLLVPLNREERIFVIMSIYWRNITSQSINLSIGLSSIWSRLVRRETHGETGVS